jgi:L-lactate dehydrogenase (cytochrome)
VHKAAPKLNRALRGCHSIADLRCRARRRLPRAIFDYLDGAADDEVTLARNSAAFGCRELLPRVLRDVAQVDLSTEIMGTKCSLPLVLAPTGMSRLFHHEGEAAVARAAKAGGILYSLSSVSTFSIEEVAAVSDAPKWFQIYVWKDRGILRELIARCRAARYTALCLTVDVPAPGNRERDLRNGFTVPPTFSVGTALDALRRPYWLWQLLTSPRMTLGNVRGHVSADADVFSVIDYIRTQMDSSITWDDAAWMIREWNGPFAIKGILHPEDARRAMDIGATGIIVSNHGGRQLDHVPAPFEMLAEIVAAAGGAQVILDGGVRRGTDILKALALGARACMIGRPYVYGLAAGGEAGVSRAIGILRAELETGMKLLGCNTLRELDASYLRRPWDSSGSSGRS